MAENKSTKNTNGTEGGHIMEASFSMLLMSVASSAAISLGLSPNPQTGQTSVDKGMARFNIDLLTILEQKTHGNLTADEKRFLDSILSDLKMKFVSLK